MSEKIKAEILSKINKGIETVRPFLVADGGDVEIVEIADNNIVKVRLLGACQDCPFSLMTLKAGIEQAIRKEWPELNTIESV